MRKRVYKFTRAEYGIGSLEKKRLKLSTIKDLNDPFDLCPLDRRDTAVSMAMDAVTLGVWKTTAILCFSRNWDNLLLWSHYGDSHKGICLGFDIPVGDPGANYDTDVLYQPNLLQIRRSADVNFDLANRLLRTKHESWSYEQEVRMFVNLNDPPDAKGLNWIEFGPVLVLQEVIIGAQCSPAMSRKVEEAVKPYGDAVNCWWAGMRPDAFLLVKQGHPPDWHTEVRQETSRATFNSIEAQLFVEEIKRSCDFYTGKLGFAVAFVYGDPPSYGQVFRGAARLNLRVVDEPVFAGDIRKREGLLSASITVATASEIEELFQSYQAAGVSFQQELRKETWGARTFVVSDPDENLILFAGPGDD